MKNEWIEEGYALFAEGGLATLKIERLAKRVHKSKSSFYHHFANLEIFVDELLDVHMLHSKQIALKEKHAKNIHPELIQILLEHKTDIFFNQQLRFNKSVKVFEASLQKSNQLIFDAFIEVWLKDLKLNLSVSQIEGIFSLALDNFFLQIHPQTFTLDWLRAYFDQLSISVQKIVK